MSEGYKNDTKVTPKEIPSLIVCLFRSLFSFWLSLSLSFSLIALLFLLMSSVCVVHDNGGGKRTECVPRVRCVNFLYLFFLRLHLNCSHLISLCECNSQSSSCEFFFSLYDNLLDDRAYELPTKRVFPFCLLSIFSIFAFHSYCCSVNITSFIWFFCTRCECMRHKQHESRRRTEDSPPDE